MFSLFTPHSTSTPYCFENNKSFELARHFLTGLRNKKIKLEKTIVNQDEESQDEESQDEESVIKKKYQIISGLLDEFDKEIEYYNNGGSNKQAANLVSEFELSSKLAAICLRICGSDYELLAKLRNKDRQNVDAGMKWGSAGIAVGAAALLPITLAGACVVGGILITGQIARYLAGTKEPRASSAYLLIELTRSLLLCNQTILTGALNRFGLSVDYDANKLDSRYQKLALTCESDYPEQKEEFETLQVAHAILKKYIEQKKQGYQENSCQKQKLRYSK